MSLPMSCVSTDVNDIYGVNGVNSVYGVHGCGVGTVDTADTTGTTEGKVDMGDFVTPISMGGIVNMFISYGGVPILKRYSYEARCYVSSDSVGFIIGSGGNTIKSIGKLHNVRISKVVNGENGSSYFKIYGEEVNVEKAYREIENLSNLSVKNRIGDSVALCDVLNVVSSKSKSSRSLENKRWWKSVKKNRISSVKLCSKDSSYYWGVVRSVVVK